MKSKVTPAKKSAAKKAVKTVTSVSPVLDGFKESNPHQGGWNKAAAIQAAAECAIRIDAAMSVGVAFAIIVEYVPFAGWKAPTKHVAARFNLTKLTARDLGTSTTGKATNGDNDE